MLFTCKEHVQHLEVVLDLFRRNLLTTNNKKEALGLSTISYLGNLVSKGRLQINPDRCRTVIAFESPRNIHELRKVSGLFFNIRRHIPINVTQTQLLANPLKKRTTLEWTPGRQAAFDKLKTLASHHKNLKSRRLKHPRVHSDYRSSRFLHRCCSATKRRSYRVRK